LPEFLSYNLPDSVLIDPDALKPAWFFWQPDKSYLVLGQSNKVEKSLYTDKVEKDGVTVLKRPSGGESVILTPNTLVIAVRLITEKMENPQVSFRKINNLIIKSLEDMGVTDLHYRGISDISIGEKKILGSSIYRKKNIVFYHAVLNLSENIKVISKYLRHPVKEPDYRKGRDHSEFVTSLAEKGYLINTERLIQRLEDVFAGALL
jgi:lipoate-protein ligase A